MFELRKTTTKQDFLDHLIREAPLLGTMNIILVSLPSFLDSSLAFNIFLNQLKGYPREVHWLIRDPVIFEIIANSKIDVRSIQYDPPRFENQEYKNPDVVEVIENSLLSGSKLPTKPNFSGNHKAHDLTSMFSRSQAEIHNSVLQENSLAPALSSQKNETLPTTSLNLPILVSPFAEPSSPQSLTVAEEPTTAAIFKSFSFSSELPEHTDSVTHGTTLDQWLSDIEKAKESLQTVRKKGSFFKEKDPASSLRSQYESDARRHSGKKKNGTVAKRLSLAVIAVAMLGVLGVGVGVLTSSPEVYTITVKENKQVQDITIHLPLDATKTTVFETKFESNALASGKGSQGTTASGSVSIVNEAPAGTNPAELNNRPSAGFYFQKGSVTYNVVSNPTYNEVLSIPGGTASGKFVFKVTANIQGAGTGISTGERMKLYTLSGKEYSPNLYGTVTEEIKAPRQGNYITDSDIATTKTQNTSKNTAKITEQLASLVDTQKSNSSLVKTEVTKETPNALTDQTAESVTTQSEYKNTLAYFESSSLKDTLQKQLRSTIQNFSLSSVTLGSDYTLVLHTEYSEPIGLNSSEVSKALQSDKTLSSLKTKYPNIEVTKNDKKGFTIVPKDPIIKIETAQ